MVKLNLGAGDIPLDGYINIDIKDGKKAYPLDDYADNSVDEIRASHILEHFGINEVFKVLQHWVSKLRAGGILKIAVPDFGVIAKEYVDGKKPMNFAGYICGGQTDANDYHKSIFDRKGLEKAFEALNLGDVTTWKSEICDCALLPISLNLQGTKKAESKPDVISFDKDIVNKALSEVSEKAKNIYSQNGEDGILEEIFKRIGAVNMWCLEVGAADGILFSNTRSLIEKGWNAILIEKDKDHFNRLVENCKDFPSARLFCDSISVNGEKSLVNFLQAAGAPNEIDLICIDIDGQDWHVWNQLDKYRPRVVLIEYDPGVANEEFIPAIGGGGQAGLKAITRLAVSKGYHVQIITEYNVICVRDDFVNQLCGFEAVKPKAKPVVKSKISAVMSMPRLCFADNIFTAVAALNPLGISLERGIGVFWGQVLTRMMELHMNDGSEYILTLDYDTYFTQKQVKELIRIINENPEYDAVCPMQIKRECESPLFQARNADGTPASRYEIDMKKDVLPISSGHFGLTLFRTASLKKLKRPWFVGMPDPDGGWGDHRKDEDIYFWENFESSGLKLGIAHKIGLGHLQLLATFPGKPQDGYKPVQWYINELLAGNFPEWCQ